MGCKKIDRVRYPMKMSQFFSLRSLLSRFTALTLVLIQLSLGVAGKTVHLQLEGGITYIKGNFKYEKGLRSKLGLKREI
jgi:hypothetical protein